MTIGRNVAVTDLLIFAVYLFLAALLLYLISRPAFVLADESKLHPRLHWLYSSSLPYFLLQFLFGSLLSALFILYFKSASHLPAIVVSLFLGILLVANEFLESQYKRFTLSWALLGLCAMLLFNFALPFLLGSVHAIWFYLSTMLGAGIVVFLYQKTPQHLGSIVPVWLIALALMLAYAVDMIPPVPLVKRDIAIVYDIKKVAGHYQLLQQASPWWVFWRKTSEDLKVASGQRVYCFSSIFAPAGLTTKLYHHWQLHTKNGWATQSIAEFDLNGGRQNGYRGYTYKSNISAGQWRVRIETETNKTIAIQYFTVEAETADSKKIVQLY
ncbi:MAG TPA: DUF2914 domain-containing protein [Methylophilaceae bacterium]|nr:DUF2914 domain-containing protein [Methylophilaceae bacterium]HAJ71304.1 DUF2914 domain-containing protein [Methylophilaceae bacterium]